MPDPDLLDGLQPGAGDPVRAASAVRDHARAALDALLAARPGGDVWVLERGRDRQLLLDGQPRPKTWAVEALVAGDAHRWACASAEVTTLVERLSGTAAGTAAVPGLRDAVTAEVDGLADLLLRAALAAWRAAEAGDKATAWGALRDFDVAAGRLAVLQAIGRWLGGDVFEVGRARVPGHVLDLVVDAREELDSVPVDERRQARELRASARMAFLSKLGAAS